MHEPAACGALPAQQAIAHSGPLADAGQTMLPATSISRSITASIALAAIIVPLANSTLLLELVTCFTTLDYSLRN